MEGRGLKFCARASRAIGLAPPWSKTWIRHCTANPEIAKLVSFSCSNTRAGQTGNRLNWEKLNRNTSSRHFYISRIVRLWNAFPVGVINLANFFASIKKRVRDHLIHQFIQDFDPQNMCTFHFVCPCSGCLT
jgi:hypothetical protein